MLTVNNLDVFYGQIQALYGVSLTVAEHEAVAVLGANGAGKSTLIKAIMGWEAPRSGDILFAGERINASLRGSACRVVLPSRRKADGFFAI